MGKIRLQPSERRIWFKNMSANFVGAFLGIILTFGTTAIIDMSNRREMARKAQISAIAHIDRDLQEMDFQFDNLRKTDTIYRTVLSYYPDRLDKIPSDTLVMFCNSIFQPIFWIGNSSAEKILTGDIEMWESFDDLNLLYDINSCFASKNIALKLYNDLSDYHAEVYKDLGTTLVYEQQSFIELARIYLSSPEARNFMSLHSSYANRLTRLADIIRKQNNDIKLKAGITDEQLHELFPDIYGRQPQACNQQ